MKFNAYDAQKKVEPPPTFRVGLVQEAGTFTIGESVLTAEVGDVLYLDENDNIVDKEDDPIGWRAQHEIVITGVIPPQPAVTATPEVAQPAAKKKAAPKKTRTSRR